MVILKDQALQQNVIVISMYTIWCKNMLYFCRQFCIPQASNGSFTTMEHTRDVRVDFKNIILGNEWFWKVVTNADFCYITGNMNIKQ
jgi:hypothetical protein